jgi:uncharacterized protein (TIGR03437 family)
MVAMVYANPIRNLPRLGGFYTLVAGVGMGCLRFLHFGLILAGCTPAVWAQAASSTTCSVPSSASFGQAVNIAATVGGMGNVPTGGVTIFDGTTPIGTLTLDATGMAMVAATFGTGTHAISCSYSGDANFSPSVSATTVLTVSPNAPKIVLNPSQNPVPAGQRLSIDIAVLGPGGVPSGSVTLLDGSSVLAVLPLTQNQDEADAQFTTSSLAPGTHMISATYAGDGVFSAGTSPTLTLIVGRHATMTTIVSATPSVNGQPVSIKVQVTSDSGTPTGTVTLTEGAKAGATLGSGTLSAGVATIVITGLTLGTHNIVANYGGDANFDASSSAPLAVPGTAAITSLLLAATPNPVQVAQTVTLTATVTSPSGTPGGSVTFSNAQGTLGTADLNGAGQATLTTSFAAPGSQVITASFAGNAQFAPSTSAASLLSVIPRQLGIVSSASGSAPVSPDSLVSIYGDHLTATVASAGLLPWPTILGGISVVFRDSGGTERLAALKFVSPGQINAVVPADQPVGPAVVVVRSGTTDVMSGTVMIADTAPALFAGDGSGKGAAAALVELVHANGSIDLEFGFQCDGTGKCTTLPMSLGSGGDVPVLVLFGTGIRRGGAAARVMVGSQTLTPSYAGPQPQYGGVDQVNVTLPAALRGAGEVPVVVTIGNSVSNTVMVRFP